MNIGALKLEDHFCWQGVLPHSFEIKVWCALDYQKLFVEKNRLVKTKFLFDPYPCDLNKSRLLFVLLINILFIFE